MEYMDSRLTSMEVAMATIASNKERADEKGKFQKEVLESKAIANIGKLNNPAEDRMWSKRSRMLMSK